MTKKYKSVPVSINGLPVEYAISEIRKAAEGLEDATISVYPEQGYYDDYTASVEVEGYIDI